MFQMLVDSTKLFLQGRLFRDPWSVVRRWAIGTGVTVAVLLLLVELGASLWFAICASALGGGALAPWLFKDVKYH